jgi:hypothetical protein
MLLVTWVSFPLFVLLFLSFMKSYSTAENKQTNKQTNRRITTYVGGHMLWTSSIRYTNVLGGRGAIIMYRASKLMRADCIPLGLRILWKRPLTKLGLPQRTIFSKLPAKSVSPLLLFFLTVSLYPLCFPFIHKGTLAQTNSLKKGHLVCNGGSLRRWSLYSPPFRKSKWCGWSLYVSSLIFLPVRLHRLNFIL